MWWVAGGLALVVLAVWLAPLLFFRPGGAAAYQEVPPAALPGGGARVTLRVAVWGAGGPAAGRFTDMRLQVRRTPSGDWRSILPEGPPAAVPGGDGLSLAYQFVVPAEEVRPGGGFEYRFRYAVDGIAQDVPGRF